MFQKRPPAKVVWKQIEKNTETTGHLAYYYSNDGSELPVRAVGKKWDNKSDPNIETKSYGMFSTCMPPARKNMVMRGDSYIFFFTYWKEQRILTGYYELEKYVDTGITPTAAGKPRKFKDYALLAKRTHFVRNGIPLTGEKWKKITAKSIKSSEIKGYGPRDFTKIDSEITMLLKNLLDQQKDITEEYVKEIHRLEDENLKNFGKRYPTWKREKGFSTNDFGDFIQ